MAARPQPKREFISARRSGTGARPLPILNVLPSPSAYSAAAGPQYFAQDRSKKGPGEFGHSCAEA
jgi:hypothetical protein